MKRIYLSVVLSSIIMAPAVAQAGFQPAAVVNLTKSEPITVAQLRAEVERLEAALGQPLSREQRREVLDAMINERLVLQAAERDRVTISDNELNQHINQLRAQMAQAMGGRQPTDAEFAAEVRSQTGLDMATFREQSRRQLIQQSYLFTQKRAMFDAITAPTETEIAAMFNLTRSQFVRPDTVRLSMIQVPFGADAAARTRARQKIDELYREIGNSAAKFNDVVARSQTANSGFVGGDFGYMPRNLDAAQRVGQDFVNLAFSLKVGDISRVFEGPPGSGFQIIMVTESHSMRSLELGDILQPGTPITVRAYIADALMQERQMSVLTEAVEALHSELRSGGRSFQVFEANLNW